MQDGPKRLPGPEPPRGPDSLQGEVKEMARGIPSGRKIGRHHPPPWGAAACLPDRIHGELTCMAAVFDREDVGREMRGPERGNNLITLRREADQVGREGA